MAALVTGSVEALCGDDGLQLARITLELLRPVPVAPLLVTSSLVRPGRRVQLVDTVVEAGGIEVAWSRALRIRVAPEQSPTVVDVRRRGPRPSRSRRQWRIGPR